MQCNAMQCLHSIVLTTLTNHVASIRLGKPITTSVAKESEWTSGIKSTEILNSDWLTAPTHVIILEIAQRIYQKYTKNAAENDREIFDFFPSVFLLLGAVIE